MRGADGIQIRLLHQTNILAHGRLINHVARHGVPVMPVNPADFYRTSVQGKSLVLEFHLTETNPQRHRLHGFACV